MDQTRAKGHVDEELNSFRLSEHFTLREFQCRCCGAVKLLPELVERLELLREAAGGPIVITSGYRCVRHNARVGGAARSRHMGGMAADIRASIELQQRLAPRARELGFSEVILGGAKCYLHVAI